MVIRWEEFRHLNLSGMVSQWQIDEMVRNSGRPSLPNELFGSRKLRLGGCLRVTFIESWRRSGGGIAFWTACMIGLKSTFFRLEEYGSERVSWF